MRSSEALVAVAGGVVLTLWGTWAGAYVGFGRWENVGPTGSLFVLADGPTVPVDVNPAGLYADPERVMGAIRAAIGSINEQNGMRVRLQLRNRVTENVETNAQTYGRILVGASALVPYGAVADTSPLGWQFDAPYSAQKTLTSCGYRIKSSVLWCGVDGLPVGCLKDLWAISVHELCHCLGLEHTATGTMYMASRGLGAEDRAQFRAYYGFVRPVRALGVE